MARTLLCVTFATIVASSFADAAALLPRAVADFGDCTKPLISYVRGSDGLKGWGYKPTNQKDFPHGASPDFHAIADFICNRLRNECMAPKETVTTCNWVTTFSSAGKDDQKADLFNKGIMADLAPKPTQTPGPPAPKPTPPPKDKYNIEAKLSGALLEYDGDIDLRWWFDNKLLNDDSADGATCPVDPIKIGNGYTILFTCTFDHKPAEKYLRAAMNLLIDESVNSKTITETKKPFRRFKEKRGAPCNRGGCPKEKSYTWFPRVAQLTIFDLSGSKNEKAGDLSYEIYKAPSLGCKICSFLAAAGGGAAGLGTAVGAKLAAIPVGGAVGVFTGVMTLGCLGGC
jgi:hypothetical protein